MNQEIKAKWVTALRSGEYIQTKGALHDYAGFCCLGVLCDLYRKENGGEWAPSNIISGESMFLNSETLLPQTVQLWAGLEADDPYVGGTIKEGLSSLNDTGVGFLEIASLIERDL